MTQQDTFYIQPPEYDWLSAMILKLKRCDKFKIFSIGRTTLGRNIYAIGAGKLRSGLLMVGGVHALEWITTLLLLRFCFDLSERKEVLSGLEGRGVIIIPCLNPDGVEIVLNGAEAAKELKGFVERISGGDLSKWQANANGVDLNHNFDAGFYTLKKLEQKAGIISPSPRQYGGEYPFSEPESKALASLCKLFDIQTAFAFHSQGEEIFYQYGKNTPVQSRLMAELLAQSSGYKISTQSGLASHGGFKDWFVEKLHRPAFTIEVGKGKNPLPITNFDGIYKRLENTLYLALTL